MWFANALRATHQNAANFNKDYLVAALHIAAKRWQQLNWLDYLLFLFEN
jgi:hypothetical protein